MGDVIATAGGPLRFSFSTPGFEPLEAALSRFGTDVADWRPFWESFKVDWYLWAQDDFRAGGRFPFKWPWLSPKYAAWKFKHYGFTNLLWRTGRLALAARGTGDPDDMVYRPEKDRLEIGVAVPYASYHQTGTATMPRRPMFYVDVDRHRQMGVLMTRHIMALRSRERQLERSFAKLPEPTS
jgi:hypothetical protein